MGNAMCCCVLVLMGSHTVHSHDNFLVVVRGVRERKEVGCVHFESEKVTLAW